MNTNIAYLFYKDYYENLSYKWKDEKWIPVFDGTEKNTQLFDQKLSSSVQLQKEMYVDSLQNEVIVLQTTYPGLLIGSGYRHEILSDEKDGNNKSYVQNELKLGFHFDYTTGLPVIPGSSVKGAILSGFKFEAGYIVELLNVILKEDETWISLKDKEQEKRDFVALIEKTIFENDGERSVYERDLFLDAFPVSSANKGNLFLGNDFITPHPSPIKSPNPVQFLKVLPQVSYQFAFRLSDSTVSLNDNSLTLLQTQKTELFLQILKDFGVGAKTNVGYGQLEELNTDLTAEEDVVIENDADLPSLESIKVQDKVLCKIEKAIYRENEDKYQIYVIPQVEGYSDFLSELNKPLPSVKISKSFSRRVLKAKEENTIVTCVVNRIGDDKRIFFKNYIEIS